MYFANFFRYISKPKAYNQVLLHKTCDKGAGLRVVLYFTSQKSR